MFVEERIAKSLFRQVEKFFSNSSITPSIDLNGAGVQWYCTLKLGSQKVSIYICDISYHPNEKGRTEEFIASYFDNEEEVSCGRTSSIIEVIKSSEEWLKNKSKEQLYKFDFIDHDVRTFQKLEREWIKEFPQLGNLSKVLEHQGSGIVYYEISANDRSCWSTGLGDKGEVYFGFTWDGYTLFETETIQSETAEVLKRYLIDKEVPSSLNKKFLWIPTNDLTESYEKGEGIKGEFIESWKFILQFYSSFPEKNLPNKKKIIKLIQDLIYEGFDKTIRAGQSLATFILSRSRRHGLMENQAFLAFKFKNDKIYVNSEKGKIGQFNHIQVNQKILRLIRELEKEEIN